MRKFLGPEGEEVEALRITDRTFDNSNPNAAALTASGGTAVLGSLMMIALKRMSVTGLFAIRTARCRSHSRQFCAILPACVASGGIRAAERQRQKVDGKHPCER
jgi:hypothetical protein